VVYAPKEMQPSKWVTEIYIPVKVAAAKRKANVSSTTSTEPAREPIPAASTTD